MTVLTITTNFDGMVKGDATVYDDEMWWSVGYDEAAKTYFRSYVRFPLNDLPPGSDVTQVRFYSYCRTAGGAAHELNINPYNADGQADPEADSGADRLTRTVAGTPYVENDTSYRTTGDKWFDLGSAACTHVENAKSAVNRFSLGLREVLDDDAVSTCDSLEDTYHIPAYPAKLEITYTPPPPVVWGGSALPQLEMAKAILGNYVPWSKRFPKLMPRMF